jgi:hypothetical protein
VGEMASGGIIYTPSFMNNCTGVQAILRFRLKNLKDCDVGINGGRDLRSTLLK